MGLKKSLPLAVVVVMGLSLSGCPGLLSPGVIRTQNLVYGKGYVAESGDPSGYTLTDLKYDLVEMEETAENRPAVIMIHGGSFESGSKDDEDLVRQANALALEGYACFLIDYRLKGDGPPAPEDWTPDSIDFVFSLLDIREAIHASFVDAKTAMRYVRANATSLRVDPNRIVLWGESAGAFAAIAAGITGDTLFSNDGADFPVPTENNGGVNTRPSAIVDCWGSAAPVVNSFDATDPPMMVFHGDEDLTVGIFLAPALEIRDACNANGIPVAYYPIEGEGHGAWV